jgi:hypothetical protein
MLGIHLSIGSGPSGGFRNFRVIYVDSTQVQYQEDVRFRVSQDLPSLALESYKRIYYNGGN